VKSFVQIVWQECLLGVLSSKTVVYVTHQVEFLPTADLILVSIYSYSIVINLKLMDFLLKLTSFSALVCNTPHEKIQYQLFYHWKI
jgi:ATP-binding cassette, subfamily C (CFTR/MRP), member 2